MAALTLARKPRPSLKQVSKCLTLPPPVGGWNARDPLPEMDKADAIVMDNMIPGIGSVALRHGFAAHVTGLGTYIETLMEYAPPSGSNKLFAAVPTAIYDVTTTGAVGGAVVTSLTNGRWQHCMFATSGGNFLVLANGADAVRNYDGTSWTSPTINHVSSSALIGVTAHVQRLWFVEKDKLDPWYLPVASISGDATKLIVAPFCKLGGYLVAIGTWSRDGGSGLDDLLVLVTSKGEVVIYGGTDPSSSDSFSQVGVFRIPEPIGRRCIIKAGSDLGILTSVGIIPLSLVLGRILSTQSTVSITDKINNAFTLSWRAGSAKFGWQAVEYPSGKLFVVNIPVAERVTQVQYVMNTVTGAWCRFTGINAGCWSLLGNNLYFGSNSGTIYRYGPDYFDVDEAITAKVQTAYVNYGTSQSKRFVMARPLFLGPDGYTPAVQCKLDYDTSPATLPANVSMSAGSYWDVATWDVSYWDPSAVPHGTWQTLNGIGQVASMAMNFSLSQEFVLNSIDVLYEPGGYF